jgi:hypothetical protein
MHQLLKFFEYDHLPKELADVSREFHRLAYNMDSDLPDGYMKTEGLKKLLEAKDCFVRAKLKPKGE